MVYLFFGLFYGLFSPREMRLRFKCFCLCFTQSQMAFKKEFDYASNPDIDRDITKR